MIRQKRIIGCWFVLALALSACSTPALRSSRHGLLEGENTASQGNASSHSSNEAGSKSANELYALKPGGPIDLSGEWQWPLDHVEISSSYGERGGKFHQGVDLRAPL